MRRSVLSFALLASACSVPSPAEPTKAGGLPFTMTPQGSFQEPFALAFLPGGALLVTEKAGKLKLRAANGTVRDIAGVPAVASDGQGGLLDVAVAPDFATSRTVYISYAEPRATGSSLALAKATLGASALQNLRVIWRQGSDGEGGQFGAVIAFAPDRQSLFIASGERQRFTPAQDPNQSLGKIVHLTLDGAPWPGNLGAGKKGTPTVAVFDPPRNSAAALTARARAQQVDGDNLAPAVTWSSGHRNPYGLAFAADGRLWEVEMGPRGGDELNLILPGKNYGWPKVSNGTNYDGVDIPDHKPGDGFEPPKLFWDPSISPGGFMIYSGDLFPAWKGSGFIAALSGESLIRVALSGDQATKAERWKLGERIRDVAQGPDGAIWLLEDGGALVKLTPAK